MKKRHSIPQRYLKSYALFLAFITGLIIMGTVSSCDRSSHEKETKPFLAVSVSIRKDIVYGSDDTEKQTLDLYLQGRQTGEPNWFVLPEKPKPTVIHIHGGAWLEQDKEKDVMYFLPYLERGWHVVNVNYRLGDNTAPQAVDDVMCILSWVSQNAEEYKFDTEAIILTGMSAGGHLALISSFLNSIPDSHPCFVGDSVKIQAVINWFGISDIAALESYLRIFPSNLNYARRWIGDEALIPSISKQYSPVNHITPRSPPVLTFHGTRDMVVPYNQAVDLHERLDKAGITNRLITMQDRNHGGFTDEECLRAFEEIFKFLAERGIE